MSTKTINSLEGILISWWIFVNESGTGNITKCAMNGGMQSFSAALPHQSEIRRISKQLHCQVMFTVTWHNTDWLFSNYDGRVGEVKLWGLLTLSLWKIFLEATYQCAFFFNLFVLDNICFIAICPIMSEVSLTLHLQSVYWEVATHTQQMTQDVVSFLSGLHKYWGSFKEQGFSIHHPNRQNLIWGVRMSPKFWIKM
jgi:hypothetical protein